MHEMSKSYSMIHACNASAPEGKVKRLDCTHVKLSFSAIRLKPWQAYQNKNSAQYRRRSTDSKYMI